MISMFPNIENFAVWGPNNISSELAKMDDLPLRMLSISLAAMQTPPVFENLTHLEILCANVKKSDCKALPKLTHLCFETSLTVEDNIILDLLKLCASLRVLIDLSVRTPITLDDPRFLVLADSIPIFELVEEWGRSANGLIGCWELADIIVQARKANFFKG